MDRSPIPSHQRAKEISGRIALASSILLVISVVTTVIALIKTISSFSLWMLSTIIGLLTVAVVNCIPIMHWQAIAGTRYSANTHNVLASGALGSSSFGIFTVIFADDAIAHALLLVIILCFIIVALCVIGIIFVLVSAPKEDKTTQVQHRRQLATPEYGRQMKFSEYGPTPLDLPPRLRNQTLDPSQNYQPSTQASAITRQPVNSSPSNHEPRYSSPPPVVPPLSGSHEPLNIMPTATPTLPPLFKDDPLYDIPHNKKARLFIRTKSNDILENCEDACAISEDEARFALCDGVSASRFARPWARLLAIQWVEEPLLAYDAAALDRWLEKPRKRLREWIETNWFVNINNRNRSMGRLEYTPAEVKKFISHGSYATFLGVVLNKEKLTYSAIAVGDTCLFHFFPDDAGSWQYKGFPLESSSEFTDEPPVITSRINAASLVASNIISIGREYKTGDILIMATDALAEWLFMQIEQDQIASIVTLLNQLEKGEGEQQFAQLVDEHRASKQLKDDDTTLIIIRP